MSNNLENYEEKYNQALKRAKEFMTNKGVSPNADAFKTAKELTETIFPELRESEDERIRKEMIDFIQETIENVGESPNIWTMNNAKKWLAWLEKQGEQKTTNKVEQKFKVGDWIISKYMHLVMQILNNDNGSYKTVETDGTERNDSYDFIERNFKLWTIQDAKDGDILMANAPFIFNGNLEGGIGCPGAHCAINTLGKFQIPKSPRHWTGHTTIPATKEQCEVLFQKMHEAGYEWDVENKKLIQLKKQSEQKPVDKIELNFHEGDWIVYKNEVCQIVKREEGCNKLVTVFGIEKELVNERNLSTARLWTIQDAKDGDVLVCEGHEYLLFKSYTDGRIKLHCWYNEQTNNFHLSADVKLKQESTICPATKEQRDLLFTKMKEAGYEWDSEKKEVRKIEQKSSWSEEDEEMIDFMIEFIESLYWRKDLTKRKDEVLSWLKSIKSNHWKPSEEQMEAIKFCCANFEEYDALKSLYNDLKGLNLC